MIATKKQQGPKLAKMLLRWLALGLLLASAHAFAQSAGTVTYVYTDPQGTPLAEADASGNITATFDYTPYGTTALGTPPNGLGYTGHVNDLETNLVYMQARYYDPATGRFLSTDPVSPTEGDAYNFNRYAYASNNPIVNIDPDGRSAADDICMGNMQCMVSGDGGGGGEAQANSSNSNSSNTRSPIQGKAQVSSNTPTHASTSEQIAKVMSEDPDTQSVHLNQSLRTVTGDPNAPNIRPDVTVVKNNGNIDQIEVRSAGQTTQELQAKLALSRAGLGVSGNDIVVEAAVPEATMGAFGAVGVAQIIFHAWVNHVAQERHDATLTPAEREWKKNCQSTKCI